MRWFGNFELEVGARTAAGLITVRAVSWRRTTALLRRWWVADQFFFQLNDVSQGLPAVEYMDLVRLRS
jgi:hypothetical protein